MTVACRSFEPFIALLLHGERVCAEASLGGRWRVEDVAYRLAKECIQVAGLVGRTLRSLFQTRNSEPGSMNATILYPIYEKQTSHSEAIIH